MKFKKAIERDLQLADMDIPVKKFIRYCTIPAAIFALNVAALVFFVLKGTNLQWIAFPVFVVFTGIFLFVCLMLPRMNAARIGSAIEADIFVPSRMLITLLESGNSVVSAFDRVSRTKTVSGRYFGKIAAEIYLGKNLNQAIEDAIKYTPSRSFKRVLEPIKNSMRTGTAIEKNLIATLDDLTNEKIVEIERYEKRLAPVSMFYMIFGTILPAIGVVAVVVVLSVAGATVTFFPFLFILIIAIVVAQVLFFKLFGAIRPLVKL